MSFEQDGDLNAAGYRHQAESRRPANPHERLSPVENYRNEIRPHWRFRTPRVARASADAIYSLYLDYRNRKDLVGMDMARRYLRMGYTRARRSARQTRAQTTAVPDGDLLLLGRDRVKAEAAAIFHSKWQLVRADPEYRRLRRQHRRAEA